MGRAMADTTRVLMRRLEPRHRQVRTSQARTDIHLQQKKPGGRKLTTAERRLQKQMRESKKKLRTTQLAQAQAQVWKIATDLAAKLGESADYWHRTLMQITAKTKASHKRSRWNAFVRLKMAERRKRGPKPSHAFDSQKLTLVTGESTKGGIKGLLKDFGTEWQALTGTEQDELTEDTYQDMNKTEDLEDLGVEDSEDIDINLKITEQNHSTPIAVFNDFRKTIGHVENEVSASTMLGQSWSLDNRYSCPRCGCEQVLRS